MPLPLARPAGGCYSGDRGSRTFGGAGRVREEEYYPPLRERGLRSAEVWLWAVVPRERGCTAPACGGADFAPAGGRAGRKPAFLPPSTGRREFFDSSGEGRGKRKSPTGSAAPPRGR